MLRFLQVIGWWVNSRRLLRLVTSYTYTLPPDVDLPFFSFLQYITPSGASAHFVEIFRPNNQVPIVGFKKNWRSNSSSTVHWYIWGCSSVVERPFRIRKASGSIPDISTSFDQVKISFIKLTIIMINIYYMYISYFWWALIILSYCFHIIYCNSALASPLPPPSIQTHFLQIKKGPTHPPPGQCFSLCTFSLLCLYCFNFTGFGYPINAAIRGPELKQPLRYFWLPPVPKQKPRVLYRCL